MKRISILLAGLTLCAGLSARAQDAATEERLNQLNGKLENIIEAQRAQQKQLEALAKEIEAVREQAGRPTGNYATQDDLRRALKAIEEVDRKRIEDTEKTAALLNKLGQKLAAAPAASSKKGGSGSSSREAGSNSEKGSEKATEKGFPYTIKQGDTLSVIVQAYRDQNIKVTTDSILKANPGLKPEKLKVGMKIWIPAPES